MPEVESVAASGCALGHGQIPYRIEQIGFSLAVSSADAVNLGGEVKLLQPDVPEVLDDYSFQCWHKAKLVNKLNLSNRTRALV